MRAVKLPRLKAGGIGPRRKLAQIGEDLSPWYRVCPNIKRELGVWRVQNCIPLVGAKTPLTCAGRQTTPSQGRRYRAENGNLSKFGRIYRLGTVFAPRQYLCQKTAMGMERPETYSFSRCKNPSYLCGPSNYPVSREAVYGRERKLA